MTNVEFPKPWEAERLPTVAELIEALQEYPQDMPVEVGYEGTCAPLRGIYTTTLRSYHEVGVEATYAVVYTD